MKNLWTTIPEGDLCMPDGAPNYPYIRKLYAAVMPEIMERQAWVDPYWVDWLRILTPIERSMWSLIRSQNVPYYPQFPVGRYFVDFGNPHDQYAIECDGQQWHDPVRDRARDEQLLDLGWIVMRVSGYACNRLPKLPNIYSAHPLAPVDSFRPTLAEMLEEEERLEYADCEEEDMRG